MNVAKLKQWRDEEHVEIASSSRKRILGRVWQGGIETPHG
jgi:hypothetical protein